MSINEWRAGRVVGMNCEEQGWRILQDCHASSRMNWNLFVSAKEVFALALTVTPSVGGLSMGQKHRDREEKLEIYVCVCIRGRAPPSFAAASACCCRIWNAVWPTSMASVYSSSPYSSLPRRPTVMLACPAPASR